MFIRNLLSAAAVMAAPAFAGAASAAPTGQTAQAQTLPAAQQARQAPEPVSRADFTKNLDLRFTAMDANKDGALSKEEIAAAQARELQQAAVQQQQRIEAQFRKLDTNKDNQLSLAEFKAAAPAVRSGATADQLLGQLDTNKDGRISVEEFRAPQLANFDKVDANSDGTIEPAEARAARRR